MTQELKIIKTMKSFAEGAEDRLSDAYECLNYDEIEYKVCLTNIDECLKDVACWLNVLIDNINELSELPSIDKKE